MDSSLKKSTGAAQTRITVNSETAGAVSSLIFGVNNRIFNSSGEAHMAGSGIWDAENHMPRPAFTESMRHMGATLLRYPGGTIANMIHWRDLLGTPEDRRTVIGFGAADPDTNRPERHNGAIPYFGLHEALDLNESLGISTIWMYNFNNGSPQDAAELVEYLNMPATPEFPMAMKRAANGRQEPWNIRYFNIGNEILLTPNQYGWMMGYSQTSMQRLYAFGGTTSFHSQKVGNIDRAFSGNAHLSTGEPNQIKRVLYTPVDLGGAVIRDILPEDSVPLPAAGWTFTGYPHDEGSANVTDGLKATRWTSGQPQTGNEYFIINTGSPITLNALRIDAGQQWAGAFPARTSLYVSDDGINWGKALTPPFEPSGQSVLYRFPEVTAQFIKITQEGKKNNWWTIAQLFLYHYRYHAGESADHESPTVVVGGEIWRRADSLAGTANEYIIDAETGAIKFGDGVNGNIPPKGAPITISYTTTRCGYVDFYAAMKAADPAVRVYSSAITKSSNEFLHLMGSGHPFDGVALHYYADHELSFNDANGIEANFFNLFQYPDVISRDIAEHRRIIEGYAGREAAQNIQVAITEYGSFGGRTGAFQATLADALFVGKILMNFIEDDVYLANKHCLTPWTLPTPSNSNAGMEAVLGGPPDFEIRAPGYAIAQFSNMTGNRRLATTTENSPKITGAPFRPFIEPVYNALHSVATQDDNFYYLTVINADMLNPITAVIEFRSANLADAVEIWELNAEHPSDRNMPGEPEKVSITKSDSTTAALANYTFPPHSMTSFRLTRTID